MSSTVAAKRASSSAKLTNQPSLLQRLHSIQIGGDPSQKIKRKDLIILLRNMTTLVQNGVSLPHALETVAADRCLKRNHEILVTLSRAVKEGQALSVAMAKFPQAFSAMLINQIRVGERSGKLDETLIRITQQVEQSADLKKSIMKKLTYPAILVVAGIGSVTFMLLYVIPTFQKMYEESGAALPAITQLLIDLGEFIRFNGWVIAAGLMATVFAIFTAMKNSNTRMWIDRNLLRLPVIGDWFRNIAVLQFVDVLGNLMASGFKLAEALPQAGRAITNRHVRENILELSAAIRRGERFSSALAEKGDLFPPVVNQLVIVGEQTGRLASVTSQIRSHLRRDVEAATNAMVAAIEPILTATLAIAVGGILLAVYLPMFDMIGQVN